MPFIPYYNWWNGEVYYVYNFAWIPVQAIAAGGNHNLALLANGTVVAWGDNSFGQSSPPSNLSNVVAIAAGYLHSAVLCSNGTVVAWGDDTFGQTNVPLGLSNVVAIAAGNFHTLALLSNGIVVGWGDDTFGELNAPSSVTNAVGIASGSYHGLALVQFSSLLQAHLAGNGLIIQWNGTGTLQWALTPTGPFTDIPCQGNSWTNLDMSTPTKFFRLRR
jgi:alpha-tubulin suppressor-like RCC1 family protein